MRHYLAVLIVSFFGLGQVEAAVSNELARKLSAPEVLLKTINLSLSKEDPAIRALENRHLERLIERSPDLVKNSCADIKDSLSSFVVKIRNAKKDFKDNSNSLNADFLKNVDNRFQSLEYLAQDSLKKCADPADVTETLAVLRKELFDTGFLIQSYQSSFHPG
ncbi:MAG: hypothetical protein AABY64_00645 [Bdellovibrionota bacterium]